MTDEPIIIDYADMTDEQKRIVDAGDQIAGTFPQGMTREQLSAWMDERFGDLLTLRAFTTGNRLTR